MVINRYDVATQKWTGLHSNLINGEGLRNAYWQACTDKSGTVHLSWMWRESADVASNHDLCYARSRAGGKTWERSTDEKYSLPVTAATAEYAVRIPQNSELINQTSMAADDEGRPFIATYWREGNETVPQYRLVYLDGKSWRTLAFNFRRTPFSLSGVGTKRIPIARPQVMTGSRRNKTALLMVFRDAERGNKVSAVVMNGVKKQKWNVLDLTTESVGSWEPTYDTELWKEKGLLHLFVQNVEQADAEGKADLPAQTVKVLQWKPW